MNVLSPGSFARLGLPGFFVALFLLCSSLRVLNFDEIRQFPDTQAYVRKASLPLLSWGNRVGPLSGLASWWLQGRSFTVPLFYKLAGNTPYESAIFQLCFSVVCWGLLALSVARTAKHGLIQSTGFLIILLFSLSDQIVMWDALLLSDSITISLLALFVACWLSLLAEWQWGKGALGSTRRYLSIGAVLAGMFIANEISQNYSGRWVTPFVNVIGQRILPDPERIGYFAERGMPVTPAVMRLSGQFAWSQDRLFYNDPELEELREWVRTRGKQTYIRFLLTHPVRTILEPLRDSDALMAPELKAYRSSGFSPVLQGGMSEVVYVDKWVPLLWVVGLGLAVWLIVTDRNGAWKVLVVPMLLIGLAYPHALVAWHGDASEVSRHALQAGVQFRLGLWLTLLFVSDRLLIHVK